MFPKIYAGQLNMKFIDKLINAWMANSKLSNIIFGMYQHTRVLC